MRKVMSYNVMKIDELFEEVSYINFSGKWKNGVKDYALELLDSVSDYVDNVDIDNLESVLLNGASDWKEYSYSGLSLIYNYDIAQRLAGPGTLKTTNNGELSPNDSESWLDVQARALFQAYNLIVEVYNDKIKYYGDSVTF